MCVYVIITATTCITVCTIHTGMRVYVIIVRITFNKTYKEMPDGNDEDIGQLVTMQCSECTVNTLLVCRMKYKYINLE